MDEVRFTPTRVGNTCPRFGPCAVCSVHPHACGEYGRRVFPRAGLGRFTPTRVGNTERYTISGGQITVHPHACGEYAEGVLHHVRHGRFTPTRVGNTLAFETRLAAEAVHPHACGEYSWPGLENRAMRGSPPRVWGIRNGRDRAVESQRFTPTRVGNTPLTGCRRRPSTVHPHACGEYATPTSGQRPTTRFTPTRVGNTA